MKSHHYEKDGNNGQGRVRVRGFVSPTGYLSIEGRGVDGSGMCNLEFFSQKGDNVQRKIGMAITGGRVEDGQT